MHVVKRYALLKLRKGLDGLKGVGLKGLGFRVPHVLTLNLKPYTLNPTPLFYTNSIGGLCFWRVPGAKCSNLVFF